MYRLIQFWRAITASVRHDELEVIAPLLGSSGMVLFLELSRNDQRHSLNVYSTLKSQGYNNPDLLVAALLHDVGKASGPLHLPYRVAVTLLQAFDPRLLARLEANNSFAFLTPFRVAREHAEVGARVVAEAGFSTQVVELVRHHHSETATFDAEHGDSADWLEWVTVLQQADQTN